MTDSDELFHYGTPRHSGRYPWGSGDSPMQNNRDFLGYEDQLRRQGLTEKQRADGFGISIAQLRAKKAIAKTEFRQAQAARALRLRESGMSNVAIGQEMKINESSVRALLKPALSRKLSILETNVKLLQEKVDAGMYLDVGKGNENHLGISSTKLLTVLAVLREKGYSVQLVPIPQLFGKGLTKTRVLAPPGTTYVDIKRNMDNIKTIATRSEDYGQTHIPIKPPASVDSRRIGVRWAEDGGSQADGVIYVRPGIPDIALGSSRYAQVRIKVDDAHFLKGMAMYKNDLPEGVDLLFNTNKPRSASKLDAMKPTKNDKDNPFGTVIRQINYKDDKGREHLSPMNIVYEEGNWRDWSRSISSQILSKQSTALAKRQLDLALTSKVDELDEILSLTNPVVKRKLLLTYGDSADSAAVHLKAAALPKQATHVILPIEGMKESEIYAPNYKNGEKVALFRHPHGGTFEIPELTVNNKNAVARSVLGTHAPDAVGIHPKVARRLSGADFDGDTVLVIPNNRRELKISPALKGLEDFDPKAMYPGYPGMKVMSGDSKQLHMGDVSNLINDMTIKGARPDEIARAVRHSMVVIDAEKHELNHKQSYIDNQIAALKEKFQGRGPTGRLSGASTLISRAGSELRVPERKARPAKKGGPIDRDTGRKVYEETGRSYLGRTGKVVLKTTRTTKLAETDDARTLSSGTPMEEIYAAHANSLKALANQARREAVNTGGLKYSPSAAKAYASQVSSLTAKLNIAQKNSPLERQAQLVANFILAAKLRDNPTSDDDDIKKIKGQALLVARERIGAKKQPIDILPDEWEAIQAGAITTNRLTQILDNANLDMVKALATPRTRLAVTPAKLAIARLRLASGYSQAEIAESIGVSVSTLSEALRSEGG